MLGAKCATLHSVKILKFHAQSCNVIISTVDLSFQGFLHFNLCTMCLMKEAFHRLAAQSPVRSYGSQLRAPAATLRLRLLEVISALPTSGIESSYAALLR